jgi:predicted enzyme related to lactoylglutathione lyase
LPEIDVPRALSGQVEATALSIPGPSFDQGVKPEVNVPGPRPIKESTMIKGLSAVSIWSADLNNLLPFYRDVLGLKVVIESPRFVVLGEAGGPSLGLGSHSDVRGRNADPARHLVGLATDDVRADWKRLKAAGVEFVEDPTDYDTVSIATLKDPEGNLVQLLQRRP